MRKNSPPRTLFDLPSETVQAFLDAISAVSVRFGIAFYGGSLELLPEATGSYLVSFGGQLRLLNDCDRDEQLDHERLLANHEPSWPPSYVSSLRGLSAHHLIRAIHGP